MLHRCEVSFVDIGERIFQKRQKLWAIATEVGGNFDAGAEVSAPSLFRKTNEKAAGNVSGGGV
jgi:hypothetical protein